MISSRRDRSRVNGDAQIRLSSLRESSKTTFFPLSISFSRMT